MKIIQIYNQQRSLFSGEETVINSIAEITGINGHTPKTFMVSSRGIEKSLIKKIKIFFGAVFNPFSYFRILKFLKEEKPDIVHFHNIYPLLSPSVFMAVHKVKVPVVMHVHSQILTCPNWYHLRNSKICELCLNGREYMCLFTNCRGNIFESAAYFLRSYIADRFRLFKNNVDLFITPSEFLKNRLIDAGFSPEKIECIPNPLVISGNGSILQKENYAAYSGRLSYEKGLEVLLTAARENPEIKIKIAGDGPIRKELEQKAPENVSFIGFLNKPDLADFYKKALFLIIPSTCYESFGLSALEAMSFGTPVIASKIGGLPEIVDDNKNGFLFEPGNVPEMSEKMKLLWNNRSLCSKMGDEAKIKAQPYKDNRIFLEKLMSAYEKAKKNKK